jgi:hypothetical protein
MVSPDEPTTALEAYKAIIDGLVEQSHSVAERLVREEAAFSKARGEGAANALVKKLSPQDRATLAAMLHEERVGGIHDALASLEWWTDCRDFALTFKGEVMPIGFAEGMHHDYIGRLNDWEWPEG